MKYRISDFLPLVISILLPVEISSGAKISQPNSSERLCITSVSPTPGEILTSMPDAITVTFNAAIDKETLSPSMFKLYRSGGDEVRGNGNDVEIKELQFKLVKSNTVEARLDGISLPSDNYWLIIRGGEKGYLTFDGKDDEVILPDKIIAESTKITIEARFRVKGAGVLAGLQETEFPNPVHNYAPILYFGRDGKLRGRYWGDWSIQPITCETLFYPGDGSPEPKGCRIMSDGSRVCGISVDEVELDLDRDDTTSGE